MRFEDIVCILLVLQLMVGLVSGCNSEPDPVEPPRPTEYGGPDNPATPENEEYIRSLTEEEKKEIEEAKGE